MRFKLRPSAVKAGLKPLSEPPVWTDPAKFFADRHELAGAMDKLAHEIAPGVGRTDGKPGRVVSEVRRINGRAVTVQRRRAGFAIYIDR